MSRTTVSSVSKCPLKGPLVLLDKLRYCPKPPPAPGPDAVGPPDPRNVDSPSTSLSACPASCQFRVALDGSLMMNGSNLVDIQLQELPDRVQSIDLSYNQLTHFRRLAAPLLKELNLDGNPIQSLKDIQVPERVERLYLAETNLTEVKDIVLADYVAFLDLSRNNINLMSNIIAPSLNTIWLFSMQNKPLQLRHFQFPDQPLTIYLDGNDQLDLTGARFPAKSSITLTRCGFKSLDEIPMPEDTKYMSVQLISDENCICFLAFLTYLQDKLQFMYGKDMFIPWRNHSTLPTQLVCGFVASSDVSFNNLTKFVKASLPPQLLELYLEGNSIDEVYGVDFPPLLRILSISSNPITYFEISDRNLANWDNMSFEMSPVALFECRNGAKQQRFGNHSLCVLPYDKWIKLYPQTFIWGIDATAHRTAMPDNIHPNQAHSRVSRVTTALIIIVVMVGFVAVIALILAMIRRARKKSEEKQYDETTSMPKTTPLSDFFFFSGNSRGIMSRERVNSADAALLAVKIPLEKITLEKLIGKGACGEVYKGQYMNEPVAVKKLLPEHRRSMKHIEQLMVEVRIMMRMDHPNIIQFIGVAWNALSELCVVSELMVGGNLRSLLTYYEQSHQPNGFSIQKIRIAKDIANGLTYLHSLDPIILHRDLKSANVLLGEQLQAKLTDFGISRETSVNTMTIGIGTSLWMAPEVMVGGRYDEKADIFSFGIVLTELDSHENPYARIKRKKNLSEAALCQQVSMGNLRAGFSTKAMTEVVEIGERCLSVEPTARPTAGEIAYRFVKILRNLLQTG